MSALSSEHPLPEQGADSAKPVAPISSLNPADAADPSARTVATPANGAPSAQAFDRKHIEGVIIDLDGTMVDTVGDFTASLNLMLADLDLPRIEADEVLRYIGKGSEHLVRAVLAARLATTDTEARFTHALERYQHAYSSVNGRHVEIYPGVAEGLTALRAAGLKLACVTNKPHRFAVELLEQLGLLGYFSLVFGGDSLPRKKPDPLPLVKAAEALGIAPLRMLAIGDSENDALAARAAGIAVLTVPYGYNHGQPVQSIDSDGIVGSLLEAAHWLDA